jgi:hypothetical protein
MPPQHSRSVAEVPTIAPTDRKQPNSTNSGMPAAFACKQSGANLTFGGASHRRRRVTVSVGRRKSPRSSAIRCRGGLSDEAAVRRGGSKPKRRAVGAPLGDEESKFARDSPLEGDGFELVWGFPVKRRRSTYPLAASVTPPADSARRLPGTLGGGTGFERSVPCRRPQHTVRS